MAGIENYEKVYRGYPNRAAEYNSNWMYHDPKIIRPVDVPLPYIGPEDSPPQEDVATVKKCIGVGFGLVSVITENLLIHPCIVLRRQCQVNPVSLNYHLIPITLVPVIIRLHQTQGINTLWKGIGSVLIVRGMLRAVENVISKISSWPQELICNEHDSRIGIGKFGRHILLKCISIGIITPLFSASLVETVQSVIASENPGIFDIFRDAAVRLFEGGNKGRLIPIYALLPPTIACAVTKYLFGLAIKGVTSHIMYTRYKNSQEMRGAYCRNSLPDTIMEDMEIKSILVSLYTADILFYPVETVIYRLHLQGTRTIIDDLDTGRNVTPLLTGYSGALDCYRTILSTEGPFGLYKGFGALILQFIIHVAVLRTTKWILTELATMLFPKERVTKPQQRPRYR